MNKDQSDRGLGIPSEPYVVFIQCVISIETDLMFIFCVFPTTSVPTAAD